MALAFFPSPLLVDDAGKSKGRPKIPTFSFFFFLCLLLSALLTTYDCARFLSVDMRGWKDTRCVPTYSTYVGPYALSTPRYCSSRAVFANRLVPCSYYKVSIPYAMK